MRFAGHEAIVIKGKAQVPSYIAINDAEVKIRDATSIWGIDAQTTGVILREREPGVGRRSIIRIGPAGEAGVRYAGVVVDTYRHFGRLGLGAVFGSKMLKALVISGTETVEVPDIKRYKEVYGRLYKTAVQTDVMEKVPRYWNICKHQRPQLAQRATNEKLPALQLPRGRENQRRDVR